MESERTSSSNDTDKDNNSPSTNESLHEMSSSDNNDSEDDSQQKKRKSPSSLQKSKGNSEEETPSPKNSSSSSTSDESESPSSSSTPPPPSPSPPQSSRLTTMPQPSPSSNLLPSSNSPSPRESPPKKSPRISPPPSPSPSFRSPAPKLNNDDASSSPPKQSPPSPSLTNSETPNSPSPSSATPSSSGNSNNNNSSSGDSRRSSGDDSPNTVRSSPMNRFNMTWPVSPGDDATHSGSGHLSSQANTRLRGPNDSSPSTASEGDGGGGGHNSHAGMYVGIAFAGVCIIAIIAICLLAFTIRKRKRAAIHDLPYMPPHVKEGLEGHYVGQHPLHDGNYKNGSQQPLGISVPSKPKGAQTAFCYENIMEITNGFSSQNIIGEGGFGCVYKGWLTDGRVVAVKKLKAGSGQGEREFMAEVEIIGRVHHRHLVSLVGYCISDEHKILMYEFVPNGSLHQHLHGKGMPVLDWPKRLKIAIGAAKGLAYLHEDCNPKIIHRDIKSANILLDNAYVAQVADFGLAKLNDDANTHVSTRVMGTFGYMAPEYATSGKLTDRSDVFSFGVVLLELLTGRKPVDQTQPLGEESLVEWARPHLIHAVETGDFSKLIDPKLERHFVEREILRMIEAAAACIRHSAPKRPRMLQVVRALDSQCERVDLSNGVKYGQSTVYNSGQYDEEIRRFRMMNGLSFGNSEFDMYSEEYSSRDLSGFQRAWSQDNSSVESESRAFFNKHGSIRHTNEHR